MSLDRLDEAVSLDAPTIARAKQQWDRGRALGRHPQAVAFVGDSITASPKFMTPVGRETSVLAPAVAERLMLNDTSVVELYVAHPVVNHRHSFSAPRAAETSVTSAWAVRAPPAANPLAELIASHQPSIAVVLFGTNDAMVRSASWRELVDAYRSNMTRIVDQLEAAGVIVVLNTLPRHTSDPNRPLCDDEPGDLSDWRIAVQTSALSSVAAELACARHLPLIDLRHALDAALDHGIGPDGVHPSAHPLGTGKLDADGLRCGYNVRNYVTLRMLRELHAALRP